MKKMKFQIDTGSYMSIINAETWKKYKISNPVTGEKFKFVGETFINVFFYRKERKLKAFFMWIAQS